ncbi:MAG: hypothetical protein VX672_04765 [Planctomycetota bacterium]|nr:hypothetical protein [Planctomycetota bacterium]
MHGVHDQAAPQHSIEFQPVTRSAIHASPSSRQPLEIRTAVNIPDAMPGPGRLFILAHRSPGCHVAGRFENRNAFLAADPVGLHGLEGGASPGPAGIASLQHRHLETQSTERCPGGIGVLDTVLRRVPAVAGHSIWRLHRRHLLASAHG